MLYSQDEFENPEKQNSLILISSDYPSPYDINGMTFRKRRFANYAFYVEAAGAGWYYSINMDFIIESKEKHIFSARIGTSAYPDTVGMQFHSPAMLFFLFGRKNMFETGIGVDFAMTQAGTQLNPVLNIGFRHQPPKGGLVYRFAFTPHFKYVEDPDIGDDYRFFPWVGIAFGWSW
ncbi:MAG: hypothetical protein ABIJ16_12075 [Bacteroidota bacterium]